MGDVPGLEGSGRDGDRLVSEDGRRTFERAGGAVAEGLGVLHRPAHAGLDITLGQDHLRGGHLGDAAPFVTPLDGVAGGVVDGVVRHRRRTVRRDIGDGDGFRALLVAAGEGGAE